VNAEPEPDVEVGGDRDPVEFGSATPPAEWALAAVGAALALAMIGFLVFAAVDTPATAPALAAEVTAVTGRGEGHMVEAEVHNDGGAAAQTVHVEGRLSVDGEVVERVETTVDYIPAGSSRTVGLVFQRDPTTGRIDVVPTGFTW
jgi:uncharacterized protein (TIGR02588 family)